MRGWKGILTGALALVFFETIVQPSASKRVGTGIDTLANLATRFLDPAVPAIGTPAKKPTTPQQEKDKLLHGGGGGLIPFLPTSIQTPTAAPAVGVLY